MPLLSAYMSDLEALIQAPTSPVPLLTAALRQHYINKARAQCAAVGDMLPGLGTLAVAPPATQYPFSAITFAPSSGLGQALAVETINYNTATGGQQPLNAIEWQRYNRFEAGHSTPIPTRPRVWTEFGQGTSGTIMVNPLDAPYTLTIRARCIPLDLTDDNTPDAIPYAWSDAVPFLAAWYCYMSLQRQADADKMLERYQMMMQVARGGATPDTQPAQFNGSPDPFMQGRLGLSSGPGRSAQPRQQTPPTAA